jgi:hypothetical protein
MIHNAFIHAIIRIVFQVPNRLGKKAADEFQTFSRHFESYVKLFTPLVLLCESA